MRSILLLLACLSPVLLGQNAGVQGIVTDQGGAVIPAARITVINPGTQTRQQCHAVSGQQLWFLR